MLAPGRLRDIEGSAGRPQPSGSSGQDSAAYSALGSSSPSNTTSPLYIRAQGLPSARATWAHRYCTEVGDSPSRELRRRLESGRGLVEGNGSESVRGSPPGPQQRNDEHAQQPSPPLSRPPQPRATRPMPPPVPMPPPTVSHGADML